MGLFSGSSKSKSQVKNTIATDLSFSPDVDITTTTAENKVVVSDYLPTLPTVNAGLTEGRSSGMLLIVGVVVWVLIQKYK